MQNITTLLGGSVQAAAYLSLVNSGYRQPVYSLTALNEDGTLRYDLTSYLLSAGLAFVDEMAASTGSFVIANNAFQFDKYNSASALSDVLKENRLLRFQKGLQSPSGTSYLLPAMYCRITQATPSYQRSTSPTITVATLDLLKNPLKQKATTDDYQNWQVNSIASALAVRYAGFSLSQINLAPVSYIYPDVQFPDYSIAEMFKALYDPLLFRVSVDEGGNLTTSPRLGSTLSSFGAIMGYPDQVAIPSASLVSYVFPDAPLIMSVQEDWKDHDFVNQVRVLGQAQSSIQSLGPAQVLASQGASAVASQDKLVTQVYFSQHTASSNDVLAKNVEVWFQYSTNHSLASFQGAVPTPGLTLTVLDDSNGIIRLTTAGQNVDIQNNDPNTVGYVGLAAVLPSYVTLKIEGRQYTGSWWSHHGGMDYQFSVHGQPLVSFAKTLTSIKDYNSVAVSDTLTDIFSDHTIYQFPTAHTPLAMGTPVEVFINGATQGVSSADQNAISTNFKVDYERGRIAFQSSLYASFTQDDNAAHPLSTGGAAHSTASAINLSSITQNPSPQTLYQSWRSDATLTYTFSALPIGQSFDVILHFCESTLTDKGQRLFDVYAQGASVLQGVDIYALSGAKNVAIQQSVTSVTPDSFGVIKIILTQRDPVTGNVLSDCTTDGSTSSTALTASPLVCGIQIVSPTGAGGSPYAVNCGGAALPYGGAGAAPVITATAGYSPSQQTYGIQNLEINDPLLKDQGSCDNVATYFLNYSAWARNVLTITCASIPHLQCGDLIQFYHAPMNTDMWVYIQAIKRDTMRPAQSGAAQSDTDTFTTYLLKAVHR